MGIYDDRSGPSQRQLRVGELVRHALAEIFNRGEIVDDGLEAGMTVLEVSMSPDLRQGTAYVMPFAGERREEAMAALKRHGKYIRGLLSKRLNLKYMPEIKFQLDTSLDYAGRVDDLLNDPKVRQDLDKDIESR